MLGNVFCEVVEMEDLVGRKGGRRKGKGVRRGKRKGLGEDEEEEGSTYE